VTRVLVTGASGGIGAAICKTLASRGVTIALHYQSNRAAAEATQHALEGSDHSLIQADLTDRDSIERLWQEACATRPIDAVINNAGIFPAHPPLTTDHAH
jgi:3-oxoacyl-[acyl-carrier protein] reductase